MFDINHIYKRRDTSTFVNETIGGNSFEKPFTHKINTVNIISINKSIYNFITTSI